MNKITKTVGLGCLCLFFAFGQGIAQGALVKISGPNSPQEPAGNYLVSGDPFTSAYQGYEVLFLNKEGQQTEITRSNTIAIDDLLTELTRWKITSTNSLVFSLTVNETGFGSTDKNYIGISMLNMTIAGTPFSLGSDSVRVYDFKQGDNGSEALFQVNLPFDIFDQKGLGEYFSIESTLFNVSDGPEYFALTEKVAVPIPGALLLFGSGLVGLIGFRRFRKL